MTAKIKSVDLKNAIRQKFAWPGGYEIFGLTNDGVLLCCDCMKKEWRQLVLARLPGWEKSGWFIEKICTSAELENKEWVLEQDQEQWSLDYCDHCNKVLNG
jgi:hypothetical protein